MPNPLTWATEITAWAGGDRIQQRLTGSSSNPWETVPLEKVPEWFNPSLEFRVRPAELVRTVYLEAEGQAASSIYDGSLYNCRATFGANGQLTAIELASSQPNN